MDPAKAARPTAEAVLWLCVLGPLFFLVYGFTNWAAAQHPAVGSLFFEWERAIPVLPWMIVPYMSIDLFFVLAPFLCSDRRELRTLAGRITMAIGLAAACFLLFPLTLAVPRPVAPGWEGVIFNWFREVDLPYNLPGPKTLFMFFVQKLQRF